VILSGHDCAEVDRVVETRHRSHLVEKTKHLELVLSWVELPPWKGVSSWRASRTNALVGTSASFAARMDASSTS
jgi:hypothetical protein